MRLTLYTRRGCHLCEEMILDLEIASRRQPFEVDLVDIDHDPALCEKYAVRVPVLLCDGQEVCAGRLDIAQLQKILEK